MDDRFSERFIPEITVDLTIEELAAYCKVQPDSAAYECLEDELPLINRYAAPKAVLRWVNVDSVSGDETVLDGVAFKSTVVADKLRGLNRVFLSVVTAGHGLEECEDLQDSPFLDLYNGLLLSRAHSILNRFMLENFHFDGASTLNPGSLPDWPVENNHLLFDVIGGAEDIGVMIEPSGYMKPWNSASHIHFPGNGFRSCILCRKFDCIGRHAEFDQAEYDRIFGNKK